MFNNYQKSHYQNCMDNELNWFQEVVEINEIYLHRNSADKEFNNFLQSWVDNLQLVDHNIGLDQSIPQIIHDKVQITQKNLFTEHNISQVTEPPTDQLFKKQIKLDEESFQTTDFQYNKDVKSYLKNFLVLLSGWICNYFLTLLSNRKISKQTKERFDNLADEKHLLRKTNVSLRRQKIYINLKKLSNMFNDEILKPYLFDFFQGSCLRYLMASKTKNKSCLLRFLPRMMQGLLQGSITHLR